MHKSAIAFAFASLCACGPTGDNGKSPDATNCGTTDRTNDLDIQFTGPVPESVRILINDIVNIDSCLTLDSIPEDATDHEIQAFVTSARIGQDGFSVFPDDESGSFLTSIRVLLFEYPDGNCDQDPTLLFESEEIPVNAETATECNEEYKVATVEIPYQAD